MDPFTINSEKLYQSPTPAFHTTVVRDGRHLHYPVASTPRGCPDWLNPGWIPTQSKRHKRREIQRSLPDTNETGEKDTIDTTDTLSDADYPRYSYNYRYTFPKYAHDPITARRNRNRVQEYLKRWV